MSERPGFIGTAPALENAIARCVLGCPFSVCYHNTQSHPQNLPLKATNQRENKAAAEEERGGGCCCCCCLRMCRLCLWFLTVTHTSCLCFVFNQRPAQATAVSCVNTMCSRSSSRQGTFFVPSVVYMYIKNSRTIEATAMIEVCPLSCVHFVFVW